MALNKNIKYNIKRKYFSVLQISFILSISLLIVAFKFFPDIEKTKLESNPLQDLVLTVEIPITDPEQLLPPPPKPPIPIEAPTDDVLEDVEINTTDWNEKEDVAEIEPLTTIDDVEPDVIFIAVEQMPEPIGGVGAIQKNITYPEFAKRAGIQGRVYVKAFVNEIGKVFKVELVKGIGGGCDEVAMEAVKSALFSPGKQRGKPVKVQVTIPIFFKLQ